MRISLAAPEQMAASTSSSINIKQNGYGDWYPNPVLRTGQPLVTLINMSSKPVTTGLPFLWAIAAEICIF
jgi:hypothetical protein